MVEVIENSDGEPPEVRIGEKTFPVEDVISAMKDFISPGEARLKEEATVRWGDEWFLETIDFADGDSTYTAYHTHECLGEGMVIRDRLWINDEGDIECKRLLIDTTEFVCEVKEESVDHKDMMSPS